MKKGKIENACNENAYKVICYGSESVDITLNTRDYLVENGSNQNSLLENMDLIERNLINYSFLKLTEWNYDVTKLDCSQINDLGYLNKVLSVCMHTKENNYGYFIQYIHCISYFLGYFNQNQNPQISIVESNETDSIDLIKDVDYITTILINPNADISTLPSILLKKIRKMFQEKVPTLVK